jgi:hypothetical protein
MQVKRALDLTDLTLSYNHRFGQGDYGETFKFEATLDFFDLSDYRRCMRSPLSCDACRANRIHL